MVTGRWEEFKVGWFAGRAKVGLYNVAADVGTAHTEEMVRPISRSLHPIYAKLKYEADTLRATYLSTLSMVATLAFPAGTGVAFVAQELVDTVLGDRWHAASGRSEEHTSELQSRRNLVCRLLLEKKKHK